MISENFDGENFLEFLLSKSEMQNLLMHKMISTIEIIDQIVYHIGIRNFSPEEGFKHEITEDYLPLKCSSKPKDVSANIREMVKAGHPQKQAVAAAMNVSRQAGRAKKPRKKQMKV